MRDRTPLLLLLALSLPAQAPQLPQARLEGQLVDPRQRPVVGAMVTAELDGELLGKTFSDASGTFVFGRLPQGIVVVRATTKTPDVGGNWVDLLGNERAFVRIVMLPARKVTGTVRDDAGVPVAGAWVMAAPNDAVEFAYATCVAESDGTGHYELTHVPIGFALVRAWAVGCDAFEGSVDGATDAVLDARIERDAFQEHVFSLQDATPQQRGEAMLHVEATKRGVPVPLPPPLRRLRLGEDSTWTVRGWPFGDEVHARVVLPEALVTPCVHVALADRGGCKRKFTVGDATAWLQGRLVGPSDMPLGNRALLAQPFEPGALATMSRVLGRSRPDGTFTLACPVDRDEKFALRVLDSDATVDGADPVRAWFVAAHDSKQHAVPIQPAHRIRLRLLGKDQVPVGGATVAVYQARATRQRGYPMQTFGSPLGFGTADLDGNVVILGLDLREGETLSCIANASEGAKETVFTVATSTTVDLGDVQLDEAATVLGTALLDERPLPGARVWIKSPLFGMPIGIVAADRDGRFVVRGLLPSHYWLAFVGTTADDAVQLVPGDNEIKVQ